MSEKKARPEICGLSTSRVDYVVDDNQMIYETPKLYQLWQVEPLRFIKQWRKVSIYFVHETDQEV